MEPQSSVGSAVVILVSTIQIGQTSRSHIDSCQRLVERLLLLKNLLDDVEVVELTNSQAAAAAFERLEHVIRKAKELLDRCSRPCYKVYMVGFFSDEKLVIIGHETIWEVPQTLRRRSKAVGRLWCFVCSPACWRDTRRLDSSLLFYIFIEGQLNTTQFVRHAVEDLSTQSPSADGRLLSIGAGGPVGDDSSAISGCGSGAGPLCERDSYDLPQAFRIHPYAGALGG